MGDETTPDDLPSEPPAPAPPPKTLSLTDRVKRGSGLTILAHLFSNSMRLGGNLVMTRLLFPEAFGLMALVNSFVMALNMFSDVGIGPSIIQNKRGMERPFLNTAWTIQVARGCILFVVACLLAWPAAHFYDEPQLLELLPVVALIAIISGFYSTKLFTLGREIHLGRLVAIDLCSQGFALLTMLVWAWLSPSVWALVAGGLAGGLFKVIASHLLPGERDGFCWDKQSASELIKFGRWIFPSTILTFVAQRSDRMILAGFLTMAQLGVYNIAYFLSTALTQVVNSLSSRVLFPYYSRLTESESRADLTATIQRLRIKLLAVTLAPLAGVIAWGPTIVWVLYDDRYQNAGWMLQVLAAGAVASIIRLTVAPVILASGDSFRHMIVMLVDSVALLTAMVVAATYWGNDGLVVAVAVAPMIGYPATAWAVNRHGVWQPKLDLAALAATAALAGLLWMIPLPFGPS